MKARLLLMAALALSVPSLAGAQEPWRFPTPAARQEAKCSPYWYEDFGAALALLGKDQAANADAAIGKLRCALERERTSGPKIIQGGTRVDYYPYLYLATALSAKADPRSALDAQQCMKEEKTEGMPAKDRQKYDALRTHIAARAAAAEYLAAAQRVLDWEGGKGKAALTPGAGRRLAAIKALVDETVKARPGTTPPTDRLGSELRGLAADELQARASEIAALEAEPWRHWVVGTVAADQLGACRAGTGEGPPSAALDAVEKCFQGLGAALRAAGRGECDDLAAMRKGFAEEIQALKTWDEWENTGRGGAQEPAALPRICETRWKDESYATLAPAIDRLKSESVAVRTTFQEQQRTILAALQQKRDALRSCLATQIAGLPEIPADCTVALGLGSVASRMAQLRQRLSPQRVPEKGLPPKEIVPCGQVTGDLVAEIRVVAERGVAGLAANKGCPTLDDAVLASLDRSLQAYKGGSPADLAPLCQAAGIAKTAVDRCWQANIPLLTKSLGDYGTLLAVARRDTAPHFAGTAGEESAPGCIAKGLETVNGLQRGPAGRIDVWAKQAIDARQRAQGCLDDLSRLAANRFAEASTAFGDTREGLAPLIADLEKGTGGGMDALPPALAQAVEHYRTVEKKAAGLAVVDPIYGECARSAAVREALERAGWEWGAGEKAWEVPSDASPGFQPDARAACAVVRDAGLASRVAGIGQDLARLRQETARLDPYLIVNGLISRIAAGDLDGAVRQVRGRRALPATGREAALTQMAIAYVFFLKKRQLDLQGADRPLLDAVEAEAREAAGLAEKAFAAFRPPERLFPGEAFRTWYENTVRP